MTLCSQVGQLARAYTRKGGKDNRRQQAARMMAFAAHAEAAGAREIGQVGGRHVVSYWRALRASGGLADATLYSHWLAIRELWHLAGKPGEPPRPFKTQDRLSGPLSPPCPQEPCLRPDALCLPNSLFQEPKEDSPS